MTTYQISQNNQSSWKPIKKPAEIVESRLIDSILNGSFPINSTLPAERELATLLGVTRPTLREALQRLARDGWLEINQGKPTRIRDYWHEGKLGVLDALSGHLEYLPDNFITNLLKTRLAMAPTYTAEAVEKAPQEVAKLLDDRHSLGDSPTAYSQFDWVLQHELTVLGQNPVFVMILNGFQDIFLTFAPVYFSIPAARQASLGFYNDLAQAAHQGNSDHARNLTEAIMKDSIAFWQQTKFLCCNSIQPNIWIFEMRGD